MDQKLEENKPARPTKWWQWFLIYPVLVTSIIGAIPTYIEAIKSAKYDVAFGKSSIAIEQDNLWQKNLACTSAPLDPFVTSYNVEVDATICKSGDVLVKVFKPNGKQFYRWVAVEAEIFKANNLFGNIAYAATIEECGPVDLAVSRTIICQKYLGNGRMLRRISVPGQGCFDEIINTYTGEIISTRPASCNSDC